MVMNSKTALSESVGRVFSLESSLALQQMQGDIDRHTSRQVLAQANAIIKESDEIIEKMDHKILLFADQRSEYMAMNKGLRAVIASLLMEIKKTDPNCAIFDLSVRKDVFENYSKIELDRINTERLASGFPIVQPRLDGTQRQEYGIL